MAQERVERRLAAILAADVVGYSRLMGMDEEGTIARLNSLREELIDPSIAKHHGRIVKTMGDGILVEFPSVVDAVRNAVEVQRGMAERNSDVPEDQRIEFRVGVNLGDIVVQGDDILGDGVNIAARLEGLADPGGICIPLKVFHEVRNKLDVGYEFIGEQKVKNIETPIPTYRVLLEPDAAGKVIGEKPTGQPRWQLGAAAAAVALIAVAVTAVWWQPWVERVEPASVERMAFPLPDKPSIAVLPFDNLTGDPNQEYFSDGLTDSLITALSQVSNLFVIARNSTFTYKGNPVKVQTVAQDLGVRYVLEGSVQRSGDRVRINAQLVDALNGRHIWAEEYDRDAADIFALQDDIKENVVLALNVKLIEGEQARIWRRETKSFEAYLLYLQAKKLLLKPSKSAIPRARQLYQKALDLDPEYTEALEEIGWSHSIAFRFGWTKTPAADLARAEALARKVMEMDPEHPGGYNLLGDILVTKGRHDEGVALCERAVALAPNKSEANAVCARINVLAGNAERALELTETAMRLSPYYPNYYLFSLGAAHQMLGNLEKSIAAFEAAVERAPRAPWPYVNLAATYAMAGRDEAARAAGAEVLKRFPKFSVSGWAKRLRSRDASHRRRILDALLKAGLPENPPLKLPDKPSIAVLPFTNMSGDAEQEYFADGRAGPPDRAIRRPAPPPPPAGAPSTPGRGCPGLGCSPATGSPPGRPGRGRPLPRPTPVRPCGRIRAGFRAP